MSNAAFGSREIFPTLEPRAYLNHASISPPSTVVHDAVVGLMDTYARLGTAAFPAAMEIRGRLKARLAILLGCEAEDLALTSSATRGLMELSCCTSWTTGDRIICYQGEFPGNITPWVQTAAATGAEIVWLAQEELDDAAVLAALRETLTSGGVRLVTLSAVQYSTGRVMPVGAITKLAHEYGAEVCVDAIQALGILPMQVRDLDVDYLVGGAHKWLMGLEGVGFIYVHPRCLEGLIPRTAGWLSHTHPLAFLLEGAGKLDYDAPIRRSIDFLESTSSNALGCAALEASVGLLADLGIPAINDHVLRYLDALEGGLVERGFTSLRRPGSKAGALVVLPPDGDAVRWSDALNARGISVSAPDGKLRLAPHWSNPLQEVELVLSTVDGIL